MCGLSYQVQPVFLDRHLHRLPPSLVEAPRVGQEVLPHHLVRTGNLWMSGAREQGGGGKAGFGCVRRGEGIERRGGGRWVRKGEGVWKGRGAEGMEWEGTRGSTGEGRVDIKEGEGRGKGRGCHVEGCHHRSSLATTPDILAKVFHVH